MGSALEAFSSRLPRLFVGARPFGRPPAGRVAAAAGVLGLVLLAGCGGGGSDDSSNSASSASQPRTAEVANFPRPSNRSFRNLIGNLLQGPELAPSVSLLEPGENRFGFALFDRGRRQIGDLDVVLYVARGLDETAHGPYPARYEPIDVRPAFRSKTSAEDPDSASSVYVARVPFPAAGSYLVSAVTRLDKKLVATSPAQVMVRASSPVPEVGEKAIRIHTPTVATAGGDVKKIDTRVPPDEMHSVDLVEALRRHRPTVLLFATPALCQSRVCGPVTDVAEEVRSEYADRADFIHMEIYENNDPNKGYRPQVRAWGLPGEPFLFTIDRRGRISSRIEGAFSVPELKAAVRRAIH
jgi:hypothetical protein